METLLVQLKKHWWLLLLLPVFLVVVGITMGLFPTTQEYVEVNTDGSDEIVSSMEAELDHPNVTPQAWSRPHVDLPQEVRGIYWTAATAGSKRGQELLAYMKTSGLNTAVIDLKMDNGALAFIPNDKTMSPYTQLQPSIEDLDGLLAQLYEEEIYRIARIAVMRDGVFARAHPELAMHTGGGGFWTDNIGSLWVDPAAPEVADYALALAREAYARGFDEIQFDYVRFASDGSTHQIVYPVYDSSQTKVEMMQRFFQTVGQAMDEQGIPVSFDLFGMTFWSYNDFNIGQRLVDAMPYADWISPMVYPSHYPNGFEGFANPALAPYEIVYRSLEKGTMLTRGFWSGSEISLRRKWRPWLQDFDIGAVYTSTLIEAQIQATRDAGASGWILWNARNVYEPSFYH